MDLETRLAAIEALLAPASLVGSDFTITGVNVHIVNGQAATNTVEGTGVSSGFLHLAIHLGQCRGIIIRQNPRITLYS